MSLSESGREEHGEADADAVLSVTVDVLCMSACARHAGAGSERGCQGVADAGRAAIARVGRTRCDGRMEEGWGRRWKGGEVGIYVCR